jgi:hydrogenase nickel incorporation protein HypB
MEIKVLKNVLDANDEIAAESRRRFAESGVFVVNLMSSPGSGKTMILERTLTALSMEVKCAVIVGDVCTTNDADRLAKADVPVVQINTDAFGGECHLGAHVVAKAAFDLTLSEIDLLIVENVGNLVCPAEFDVGEDVRAVVLSVTEGEDKPVKYPQMFRICEAALLNKIDLLPYLDYDRKKAVDSIRAIRPQIALFELSAKTGEGFDPWLGWLKEQLRNKMKRSS